MIEAVTAAEGGNSEGLFRVAPTGIDNDDSPVTA